MDAPQGSLRYQVEELHRQMWQLVCSLPLPARALVIGWLRLVQWYYRVWGIGDRERQRQLDEQWARIQKAMERLVD